jgi:uncharacterized membrane protein
MKLNTLVDVMNVARKEYDLNADDLAVLLAVSNAKATGGATTIMQIVSQPGYVASSATVHERIKRLCARGYLIKTEQKGNMRCKELALGDQAIEAVNALENLA